jgi:hypothetical protein
MNFQLPLGVLYTALSHHSVQPRTGYGCPSPYQSSPSCTAARRLRHIRFLSSTPAISCRTTNLPEEPGALLLPSSPPGPSVLVQDASPPRRSCSLPSATSAGGTPPSRRQNLRFQEQRGNSVSTFTLSRPPLTHPFRSCLPTRDSTPTVFRPCRFSRLRRLTPRTAFRHFSASNASGVTTLQSILPYQRSKTEVLAAVFPLRMRTPFSRMDDADPPLFLVSEIGTRSERGLSAASSLEVVSASQCVSDGWGAQLSWASSGGHLTKARPPVSAGATPANRPPRSPVVSERLFPSGLFSLRRPPGQLGFRSWAFPFHQDES